MKKLFIFSFFVVVFVLFNLLNASSALALSTTSLNSFNSILSVNSSLSDTQSPAWFFFQQCGGYLLQLTQDATITQLTFKIKNVSGSDLTLHTEFTQAGNSVYCASSTVASGYDGEVVFDCFNKTLKSNYPFHGALYSDSGDFKIYGNAEITSNDWRVDKNCSQDTLVKQIYIQITSLPTSYFSIYPVYPVSNATSTNTGGFANFSGTYSYLLLSQNFEYLNIGLYNLFVPANSYNFTAPVSASSTSYFVPIQVPNGTYRIFYSLTGGGCYVLANG